jgi:protein-tyrosine phosphatase
VKIQGEEYRRMKRACGPASEGQRPGISISPTLGRARTDVVEPARRSGNAGQLTVSLGGTNIYVAREKAGMDITWVTDRIAVGGGIWNAENMAAVSRAGITHIIDMQIEFDDTPLGEPFGIEVCWNPIDDDFEPKPAAVFTRGVEFGMAALEDEGTKLLVHCAAGVHRAPMMTLALLAVMGWKLDDAQDLIEARRPAADFAEVYVRSVENFLKSRESLGMTK